MSASDLTPLDSLQREAENRIVTIRGQQVMLDSDLAEFYGIETRLLNAAAKRNEARFPLDFRFQLSRDEWAEVRSHFAISPSKAGGGRAYRPWVYTAKGSLAAAGVLKSKRANEVAVAIPRAFEAMAQSLNTVNKVVVARIEALEAKEAVTRGELRQLKKLVLSLTDDLSKAVGALRPPKS